MPLLQVSGPGDEARAVNAAPGVPLAAVLRQAGGAPALPCGGRQSCGKCLVWARGAVSPPGPEESALLAGETRRPPAAGFVPRLACFCTVEGDAEVLLPEDGAAPGLQVAPITGPLPAYDGGAGDDLGLAIDIGTTTVTAALFHLGRGAMLGAQHGLNAQSPYGADVLSRIAHAGREGPAGLEEALRGQLRQFAASLLAEAGESAARVKRVVATGNTTMLHFLVGLDTRGIGVAPFTPASLFGESRPAGELFPALAGAELYIPPCVGAYVGADITCGLLACGFGTAGPARLLVDVGTNGEMALAAGGRVLCCATAAGPAFEGAEISMGMPAVAGAISDVRAEGGGLCWRTIGGAPPKGLCGTGIISAVAFMLQHGVLSETGQLLAQGHAYTALVTGQGGSRAFALGASGVCLTQQDIRQVQLAKAAIAAGVQTLLGEAALPEKALETLYLAGGFGSYINTGQAAAIGLVPPGLAARARAVGNSAFTGAVMLLFSQAERRRLAALAASCTELSLSQSPAFMDAYVENMLFGEE